MTETSQPSKRQRKVDSFLRAANIGTLAVLAGPIVLYFSEPIFLAYKDGDPLLVPALIFLFLIVYILVETYAVFSMFFKRNTDEFTQSMWHSGTTWAFFAAIVWLLLGIWVEAVFLGADASTAYEAHTAAQAQGLEVGEFKPDKSPCRMRIRPRRSNGPL